MMSGRKHEEQVGHLKEYDVVTTTVEPRETTELPNHRHGMPISNNTHNVPAAVTYKQGNVNDRRTWDGRQWDAIQPLCLTNFLAPATAAHG